jgi:hypothetical protein
MHELLDDLVDQSVWSMTDEETRSTLVELTTLKTRVAELELRVAAHAQTNRVGDASGATSTAAWWANATRQTKAEAARKAKLAMALEHDDDLRLSLARGEVLPDQAAVILRAVDELPDDVVAQAEAALLEHARHFDAKHLRILGKRVLEVVDPHAADSHEARLLEKEEREALAAVSLSMSDDGHGKSHGRFTIPTTHKAMLKKALMAIAAPKHRAAVDGQTPVPGRPSNQRMGEAFLEFIERYPTDRLPRAGGLNATVVVTMTKESLLGGLKAAQLDTGERISAGEARRLACGAGIIPAVLGGQSQVLDLGRKRRFHSERQRIVATIEQGGCSTQGCDWPPGMCHSHHDTPWREGGPTSVANGRLLCPRHHALAHRTTDFHCRT